MGNRFEGRLDRTRGVQLFKFQYNGIDYRVKSSQHSLDRFADHGVNYQDSLTGIIALGRERLDFFAGKGADVAIIDKQKHITTILVFEAEGDYCEIRISTIIPRDRVFLKDGTKCFCLNNYKGGLNK